MDGAIDVRKIGVGAAMAVVPGLLVLVLIGAATGRLSLRGPPVKARTAAPTPPTAAPERTPAPAKWAPAAPASVRREDALRTVGRFVGEAYDADRRGRLLARETTEFVRALERLDRLPAADGPAAAAARRRAAPPPPGMVLTDEEREVRTDEGLGLAAVQAVLSGREGVALGEYLGGQVTARRRQAAADRAAEFKAAREFREAEARRVAAEEQARRDAEQKAAARSARRRGSSVRNPRPTTAIRRPPAAGID